MLDIEKVASCGTTLRLTTSIGGGRALLTPSQPAINILETVIWDAFFKFRTFSLSGVRVS